MSLAPFCHPTLCFVAVIAAIMFVLWRINLLSLLKLESYFSENCLHMTYSYFCFFAYLSIKVCLGTFQSQ